MVAQWLAVAVAEADWVCGNWNLSLWLSAIDFLLSSSSSSWLLTGIKNKKKAALVGIWWDWCYTSLNSTREVHQVWFTQSHSSEGRLASVCQWLAHGADVVGDSDDVATTLNGGLAHRSLVLHAAGPPGAAGVVVQHGVLHQRSKDKEEADGHKQVHGGDVGDAGQRGPGHAAQRRHGQHGGDTWRGAM